MQKILLNNEALPILRSGLAIKGKILSMKEKDYIARIKKLEKKYKMSSAVFIERYYQGDLGDDAVWLDWLFLYEAYKIINEQRKVAGNLSL
jgi:hypothetical protein